jgi:uncharacterized membrane protein
MQYRYKKTERELVMRKKLFTALLTIIFAVTLVVSCLTPALAVSVEENGWYDSKEEVALYLHTFGHLPSNYVTKREARAAGWENGSLE